VQLDEVFSVAGLRVIAVMESDGANCHTHRISQPLIPSQGAAERLDLRLVYRIFASLAAAGLLAAVLFSIRESPNLRALSVFGGSLLIAGAWTTLRPALPIRLSQMRVDLARLKGRTRPGQIDTASIAKVNARGVEAVS
jgi:hypothetical protein